MLFRVTFLMTHLFRDPASDGETLKILPNQDRVMCVKSDICVHNLPNDACMLQKRDKILIQTRNSATYEHIISRIQISFQYGN